MVKSFLGTRKDNNGLRLPVLHHDIENVVFSDSFDARTQWPDCPSIGQIRDQGACASGWALSTVGAMSDRYCIASNGTLQIEVSAEDLITCGPGPGCDGGIAQFAWLYWLNPGLVTGGAYGSKVGCQPYEIAPCEHNTTGKLQPCGKIPVLLTI